VDQTSDLPLLPDWAAIFAAAKLDLANFTPTQPQWVPQSACDARAAWTGKHPALPEFPLRIEAAAYRGKPVYFQLIWPWTRPERMQDYQGTARQLISFTILLIVFASVLLGATLLARYNIRLGRGDQRGASGWRSLSSWSKCWFGCSARNTCCPQLRATTFFSTE
jgi:hypothetical protein